MTGRGSPELLVLAPLRIEARAAATTSPNSTVVRTGAGPAKAADTADGLIRGARPGAVAVVGVAGALVAGLDPGTIVVADRVLDASGRTVTTLASAPLIGAELLRRGIPALVGPVLSSPRLVRGSAARAAMAATGALAVDMETATLLERPWGAPVAVLRAIADTPGREIGSPSIVSGGFKALGAIRAAVPVIEAWAAAVGPRQVVLAGPRSFCAGVERAIRTVERVLDQYGTPVYVRRQIVHNRHVVDDLERRGAIFVHELDEIPDGATVVYSAHGVAPAVRADAAARRLNVIDATCPLVAKVHHEVRRFSDRGYQVVLIGHAGHDETEGTLGEAEGISLIEAPDDVDRLDVPDPAKLAYITQTTLSPDDVAGMVDALSKRFPAVVGPHATDICYATQNRQDAVRAIAADCDLMLVVGSANSSNTARLVEVSERLGCPAVMIEDASGIRFDQLMDVATVGVTAGASAPPALVAQVVHSLAGLGELVVDERSVRTENVNFPLPLEVR